MTPFELARLINTLNMILDNHDKSVRLSRDSELEAIEDAINAFHLLLNYLPDYDRKAVTDLLKPVDGEGVNQ